MNRTLDRLLIGIMSFGYLIAAIFLVGLAFGWMTPLETVRYYLLQSTNSWIMGITGIILFLLSFALFIGVVHETPLGSIKITLAALDNLVIKAARSVQGIREVKAYIKAQQNYVSIQLTVQVQPDLNIPQMTEELQKKVKEYLTKTTGINVHDVRVIVNRITWEVKNRVE
ncbi:MAG: hypothetical protein CVU87_13660 [Firmicutes bacterium HGW-Firmicutes-12]|nr:MAG: hypothetical protein CVU87_13660 [Firmicutes bacterium HGW-Firmicutes-12]